VTVTSLPYSNNGSVSENNEVEYSLDVTTPVTVTITITDTGSNKDKPHTDHPFTVSFLGSNTTVNTSNPFKNTYTLVSTEDITIFRKDSSDQLSDYNITIMATPLPPALILFGTALAGLTWLGLRRREAAGAV
jgi:hypothetical protein